MGPQPEPKLINAPAEKTNSSTESIVDYVNAESEEEEDEEGSKIPELAKLASESTNFENFLEKVITWVNIEKNHKTYFCAIINAATQTGKVSWKNIEAIMKRDGVRVNAYAKLRISKSVAKKFENSKKRVTILRLIKDVASYRNVAFRALTTAEGATSLQRNAAAYEQPNLTSSARVKMPCMPSNQYFEEILGSIDKTEPIETRIRHVLAVMGLSTVSYRDSQVIVGIATEAVKMQEINLDVVYAKLSIPKESQKAAIMKVSALINSFVEKCDPEAKMVKALEFLKDLQHVVMTEQEISVLV